MVYCKQSISPKLSIWQQLVREEGAVSPRGMEHLRMSTGDMEDQRPKNRRTRENTAHKNAIIKR